MSAHSISISTGTLIKITLFALGLFFIYQVWHILLIVFVAILISSVMNPFVSSLQNQWRVPRFLAVLFIYLVFFGFLILTGTLLAPIFVNDVPHLYAKIVDIFGGLSKQPAVQEIFKFANLNSSTGSPAGSSAVASVFQTARGVLGGLVSAVLLFVITFYLVVQKDAVELMVKMFTPAAKLPFVVGLVEKIRAKLGSWIIAQIGLSCVVGLMVFLGLRLLGMPYAGALGLLAAILEFVPYVGPVLASLPAFGLAFMGGGVMQFLLVFILYNVIQQVENHILVPKFMEKAVGLHPIVSIVAIVIGAQLAGVLGALLAIPLCTCLQVVLEEVWIKKAY